VRRLLKLLLITLGTSYLALCVLLFFTQRKLIFPAPVELVTFKDGFQKVAVPNQTFFLWKQVPGDGPVVVHFHGNAEQVGYLGWLALAYESRGVSFVAVEYPGYPGTTGGPSEDGIVEASEAALKHLTTELKIDRSRLVLEGQSVGTGVAVTLAARGWGRRLVLLSPYTSLPDVAAKALPFVPARLLMRDRFDSASRAGELKVPTLIIHGTNDQVIPYALGESLSKLIPGAKLLTVEGGGHNDLWDRESTQQAIFDFVIAH
jgi:uncharacterized protein